MDQRDNYSKLHRPTGHTSMFHVEQIDLGYRDLCFEPVLDRVVLSLERDWEDGE